MTLIAMAAFTQIISITSHIRRAADFKTAG